ncbi:MAG: tRNA uridine-5-carboxymethylaminomethyl(34) synthesis GTPase MnmE [Candidatus Berkiellales bacterium]
MAQGDFSDLTDTIAAMITPPGRGGVGVIRISGPRCTAIAKALLGQVPLPRQAILRPFYHSSGMVIDQGLVIYFPEPNSFTGEEVLELQGHGGPVVMDLLLEAILQQGARLASPGEFSQRAFLNGKMDLLQAEAVADLIEATTQEAVFSASRSLQGEFSQQIDDLSQALINCRMYVEAAIDFPEEEVDFLSDGKLLLKIETILEQIKILLTKAKQGQLLKEGMVVAIVGQPNAGKSSLLNCLTQNETAIVTPIAGTTRDLVRETIQIEGMPVHLVDTAGIRLQGDLVEQEGIRRAKEQLALANCILLVIDITQEPHLTDVELDILNSHGDKVTLILNKMDLVDSSPMEEALIEDKGKSYQNKLCFSAKTGFGIHALLTHLKTRMGYQRGEGGILMARRRHLVALQKTLYHGHEAQKQLAIAKALECAAEELRLAQCALGEIVGKVTSDDLLGEIFSRFCIGK